MIRVVSLLPAATEIVCALDLRNQLFGRSHECDFPPDVAALPTLTRARVDPRAPSLEIDREVKRVLAEGTPLYALDEERLAELRPDVVVTQAACEVCAISYEEVTACVSRRVPGARVVSLQPARLSEVWQDVRTVADACGAHDRADALLADVARRLGRLRRQHAGAPRPRVAVIEWLDPLMLAGHWIPDVIDAAGGDYVGPRAGERSPYASWDDLRRLAPDALIVAPCGFDLERTRLESEAFRARLTSIARRALLLDGNAYLNRPGPRLLDAIELVAGWLRGALAREENGLSNLAAHGSCGNLPTP